MYHVIKMRDKIKCLLFPCRDYLFSKLFTSQLFYNSHKTSHRM